MNQYTNLLMNHAQYLYEFPIIQRRKLRVRMEINGAREL